MLPRSLRRSTREVERANLELAGMLGRWPTTKELAMRMGLSPRERAWRPRPYFGARDFARKDDDRPRQRRRTPWEASDKDEYPTRLPRRTARPTSSSSTTQSAFSRERDREIVQLRYGRNLPFHEIGRLMNLSESRVCQLHKRIISSLRGPPEAGAWTPRPDAQLQEARIADVDTKQEYNAERLGTARDVSMNDNATQARKSPCGLVSARHYPVSNAYFALLI